MRFVKFNDMPSQSSKYALNSSFTRATTNFKKQTNRDSFVVGDTSSKNNVSANLEYDVSLFNIAEQVKQSMRKSGISFFK